MAVHLWSSKRASTGTPVSEKKTPDSLPAVLRERDLALLSVLFIISLPDIQGMHFAGSTTFFYWFLAFLTFQLPSILIFGWLTRQSPARVPVYTWILRLQPERWRSLLLFLVWWVGVVGVLAALGVCLSFLERAFPPLSSVPLAPYLAFTILLVLATLLTCLPLRALKIILWVCGFCYVAFFAFLSFAALTFLATGHATIRALPHSLSTALPEHFSWSLFNLALLGLLGLNGPLLMNGEMRGTSHCLRCSSRYLWWGGCCSFLILLIYAIARAINDPLAAHGSLPQTIGPMFGPDVTAFTWLLLLLGTFDAALAYLLVFSRAFLYAARQGYLPRRFAGLSRSGVPWKAILAQSAMIACAALLLFVVFPALLRASLPAVLLNQMDTGDQFGLLTSISGSLWSLLNALMFLFAAWLFFKKGYHTRGHRGKRLFLPAVCLSGFLTSLLCASAPLMPDWPSLFLSHNGWFRLVLPGILCSLTLAWIVNELPRRSALLRDKEESLAREKKLRAELQRISARDADLLNRLREAYDEQQVSILQQKLLVDELKRLYKEQEQAAITDAVTGLLNHRAFIQRLDEKIAHCQRERSTCIMLFIDLDHFKEINDTWGHLAGDAVLHEIAQRLREEQRPEDVVARYGGEEFALLMVGPTLEEARARAEHLRQVIHATPCEWQHAGETKARIFITASIGIAAYGPHGTQREELIEKADQAMYQAKLAGRDCVRIADEGKSALLRSRILPPAYASSRNLYEQVENLIGYDMNKNLISAQALQALAVVMQVRDCTTSAHSSRLIWLAEETGRRLSVSDEELFLMRLGGLLHDIGKIGIPDSILNKPGPLNEEEWEIMRKHPVLGARILEEVGGFFRPLARVVIAHHERWDGYGYPRGLRGQEIPLAARVLGVADTYDAMVSRRPYKEPIPPAAAEAEIRRCSGTQFDPVVVQAFLATLKTPESKEIISRQM
jgi:diguanylate cyclase (GGDEF)-like protein